MKIKTPTIKITTLLSAAIFMAAGAIPAHFATVEYVELKIAAKPAQDRADLQQLGFTDIPFEVDNPQRFALIK
jgi:hypothetical protein